MLDILTDKFMADFKRIEGQEEKKRAMNRERQVNRYKNFLSRKRRRREDEDNFNALTNLTPPHEDEDLLPTPISPASFTNYYSDPDEYEPRTPSFLEGSTDFDWTTAHEEDKKAVEVRIAEHSKHNFTRLGSCSEFTFKFKLMASYAIVALNRRFASIFRRIPMELTRAIADYLWPADASFIYNHVSMNNTRYMFVTCGWCTFPCARMHEKCDHSTRKCHSSYLVEENSNTWIIDQRIPTELYVVHAHPSKWDTQLRGVDECWRFRLPISKFMISISHVTSGGKSQHALSVQMCNAIWRFGGIHVMGGYPAPLCNYGIDDLETSINKDMDVSLY